MLIQLHLKPTDTRATKAYRLQVKERLYRFNYVSASVSLCACCSVNGFVCMGLTGWLYVQEILAQLEEKERLEKLEETFQSVYEDYRRILLMVR